jgi:hypothetical protein
VKYDLSPAKLKERGGGRGPNVRPHNPSKNVSGRKNQQPNWGQIFTERAERGAEFLNSFVAFTFP